MEPKKEKYITTREDCELIISCLDLFLGDFKSNGVLSKIEFEKYYTIRNGSFKDICTVWNSSKNVQASTTSMVDSNYFGYVNSTVFVWGSYENVELLEYTDIDSLELQYNTILDPDKIYPMICLSYAQYLCNKYDHKGLSFDISRFVEDRLYYQRFVQENT